MKKLSCVLLSIVLMLSLSACSDDKTRLYAGACTYYADGGLMSFSEYVYKYDKNGYPVEYGCAHYLGPELEGELRGWYWLCNAGVYTASIMANGDVGACLDIERRPETIQGNIRSERFSSIWKNQNRRCRLSIVFHRYIQMIRCI